VYEPARQVGGDFYDHFVLPGNEARLGLVIADVSDKGVPAALFMALSRTMIRSNALRGYTPVETLVRANQYIVEDSHSDMFVTAFYGALETENGRFCFTNAGHNPPLWWQAASRTFEVLRAPGIVLGIFAEISLEERAITMAPGDVLLLYTDGITEAMDENQEEFGMERLQNVVAWAAIQPEATADSIAMTILSAVKRFMGTTPQADDLTLLAVKRKKS
jgi:sigma-B regulation protein RsbU (phosphoserine phosphatase)